MKKPISSKKEQLFEKETSEEKIASVFYRDPYREYTLSGIAERAKVSKSMASSILKEMAKEGFISIEELGKKYWRVKASIDNPVFKNWKIVNNITEIMSTPITDFLVDKFNPKSVILFGSFRWGEDKKGSDIDIAIEVGGKTQDPISLSRLADREREHVLAKDVRDHENDLERNIQIHFFNRKTIDKNLFNNIANGIILYGFLEVNK